MKGFYSIPLGIPFLPALVEGLIAETSSDPISLARYIVILPSQRGCLALRQAFLAATPSGCRILPQIMALADVEEGADLPGYIPDRLPPAISFWHRLGMLSQLVLEFEKRTGEGSQNLTRALRLSQELVSLVDEVETAGLNLKDLKTLVNADYAAYWQLTLDFLKILTDFWPPILMQAGCVEPAARKRQVLEHIALNWHPQIPVILAGLTATSPATTNLAQAILKMERGRVVLAGVDHMLSQEERRGLAPTHPQYALAQILQKLDSFSLQIWPTCSAHPVPRSEFLSKAMASTIQEDWRMTPEATEEVSSFLQAIETPSVLEEARQIALIMRYELETPDTTIALITPDVELARRVQAVLGRWGLYANMSNGLPFVQSYVGRFLMLSSLLIQGINAAGLLALLKHPLYAKGQNRLAHLAQTRQFEIEVLRKVSPPNVQKLLFPGYELCAPLFALNDGKYHPFAHFLKTHAEVAEALVGGLTGKDKVPLLWEGEDGRVAFELWQNLLAHSNSFPPLRAADYPSFLRHLMASEVVRDVKGIKSRLLILGTLEARLFPADVVILGELNEGIWPGVPEEDLWLNRSMRANFGLPPLERKIGLSAYDFCMALAAPKIYMARALKRDGVPTVPSRWWQRLSALLATGKGALTASQPWAAWSLQLDYPAQFISFTPPEPCPPLSMRPCRLSVTDVERLLRDPYSIYAKMILKLSPLDPLDADVFLVEKGRAIHQAFDEFMQSGVDAASSQAVGILEALGAKSFGKLLMDPRAKAFWWPRFQRLAQWFLDQMAGDQAYIHTITTEVKGYLEVPTTQGPIILNAKADRIDVLKTGQLRIIDYKTGNVPSKKEVKEGYAPQLPLEGVMLRKGGFPSLPPLPLESLCYWKVTGGTPAGDIIFLEKPEELLAMAEQGVHHLFEAFLAQETPFYACPNPQILPVYHEYAHLERLKEWL